MPTDPESFREPPGGPIQPEPGARHPVGLGRRRLLRLLAAAPPLVGGWGGLLLSACDEPDADRPRLEPEQPAPPAPDKPAAKPKPVVKQPLPWRDAFVHQDLIEGLSLAGLRAPGLSIDFGSGDCFKYILGGWRTGWGEQREHDGVTYAHAVTTSSRVYFHADRVEALQARFRIKRIGAKFFSLYLNDKPVERVDLTRADWTTYSTKLPAARVRAGVNHMLLRWDKTTPAMGEDVAAAVDWLQLLPVSASPSEEGLTTPSLASSFDGKPALALPNHATLSYWLEVPAEAPRLGFELGVTPTDDSPITPKLTLTVTAHRDGQESLELLRTEAGGSDPKALTATQVDLTAVRGQVVRLDIQASSEQATTARASLVQPGLFVKRRKPAARPNAAKNVIVVMVDTLRADHINVYAETRVKAPALEKFGEEGAVFERFSAVEDWTKPSCATMLTGLYPQTHKTQSDGGKLPAGVRMVSEELKQRGVRTGAFIANGYVSNKFGFGKGWDQYTNYIRERKKTEAEYVFADAHKWIADQHAKGERFFAYVHTIDPHVPYDPPPEFLKLYEKQKYTGGIKPRSTAQLLEDIKRKKFTANARDKAHLQALYDGEISYHDKWFGDFLGGLKALGIEQETLVVVVSDHGEEFWEHGSVGHGHQIHQELIHVPFIMRWPGTIPAGVRASENYDHASLVPTIFDAMQLNAPGYLEAPSVLARAMGSQQPGPHAGFSTHQNEREAVWSGRHKLVMRGPVRTYLYDVDKDPHCQQDLDEQLPITLTYMRALLGMFHGARNKRLWRNRKLGERVAARVRAEKVKIDKETGDQLKALGYFR